ncbi:MAG: hypothetical protein AAB504_03180 [Patescibacteria group bacterium]
MEEFVNKNEKIQEESEELLVERIKKELSEEKSENLEKKEKGETYNPSFINLDIDLIGWGEAKLWDMYNNIKTREDLDKAIQDFYVYRGKIIKEIKKEKERGEFKGTIFYDNVMIHPKDEFISILGNKLTGMIKKVK